MEQPKKAEPVVVIDKHGKRHHKMIVLSESDDLVREQVGGFLNFLRDYAVVGLAIGFIIGQQAQFVIKQLVDSFITPVINFLIGAKVQDKVLEIGSGNHSASIAWGKFLYVLLNFVFVMIFIYAMVKILKLDKLIKPKDAKDEKKSKKKGKR